MNSETSQAATNADDLPLDDLQHMQFECMRNAYYHEDRERFFTGLHRLMMAVVVVFALGSLTDIVRSLPGPFAEVFVFLAGVAGLLDLLFGVTARMKEHNTLRKRSLDLLARASVKSANLEEIKSDFYRLLADEPPQMHIVNDIATNSAVRSLDLKRTRMIKIGFLARRLRHLFAFAGRRMRQADWHLEERA